MHYVCSKGEGFFTRVLLSCWAISQMCPKSRPVVFSAVFETRGRIPFSLSPYHKFSLHLRECIKKSYILLLLPPQPSLQINYPSCNLPTKARRNSYRLFARPTPPARFARKATHSAKVVPRPLCQTHTGGEAVGERCV